MLKLALIYILLLFPTLIFGQTVDQRIEVKRGKSVDFIIRSMYETKNGKTLGSVSGHTDIDIYFDTVGFFLPAVTGWNLYAYAVTTDLQANSGGPNMNLNKVVLRVTVDNSGTGYTKELTTNTSNIIATGNLIDGPNWNVSIVYDCGKQVGDEGFLGFEPDYYFTDLILQIAPY